MILDMSSNAQPTELPWPILAFPVYKALYQQLQSEIGIVHEISLGVHFCSILSLTAIVSTLLSVRKAGKSKLKQHIHTEAAMLQNDGQSKITEQGRTPMEETQDKANPQQEQETIQSQAQVKQSAE